MNPIVFVADLRKAYTSFTAVDGIAFQVSKAECFGLHGPIGTGKTSTIRMLYGYSPLSSGSLRRSDTA